MYYATLENDGPRIFENATIGAFKSMEAARAFLLKGYDPEDWNHDAAVIKAGEFGDCWMKVTDWGTCLLNVSPFNQRDLYVFRPGQHPGGNRYWITPIHPVLVVHSWQVNQLRIPPCRNFT